MDISVRTYPFKFSSYCVGDCLIYHSSILLAGYWTIQRRLQRHNLPPVTTKCRIAASCSRLIHSCITKVALIAFFSRVQVSMLYEIMIMGVMRCRVCKTALARPPDSSNQAEDDIRVSGTTYSSCHMPMPTASHSFDNTQA